MKVIEIDHLSKIYPGGKKAVNSVSLNLNQGEIFGFLGPNGAGKTTMIKMLNGLLTPSEGSCRVHDIDPFKKPEEIHALSGVVTEHAQMYDNLTGIQNLVFYGTAFGISQEESKKRAEVLLETLNLAEVKNQKLGAYSTGMRQRLSLARAIIHQPKVLFLDEPTSGLDPESAKSVNCLIQSLANEKGMTIFLCTHQLRYAQEICTSYGLINEGVMLALGTLEELRSRMFSVITVNITASVLPDGCKQRKTGEQDYEIDIQSMEEIPQIIRKIVEAGGKVYHVSTKFPSLEDIYFRLIENRKGKDND